MNEVQVTEQELSEGRMMVAAFRGMGASEYDAHMLAASISIARRGTP